MGDWVKHGCTANLFEDASEGINVSSNSGWATGNAFWRQILSSFSCRLLAAKPLDRHFERAGIGQQDACVRKISVNSSHGVRLRQSFAYFRGDGERLLRLQPA